MPAVAGPGLSSLPASGPVPSVIFPCPPAPPAVRRRPSAPPGCQPAFPPRPIPPCRLSPDGRCRPAGLNPVPAAAGAGRARDLTPSVEVVRPGRFRRFLALGYGWPRAPRGRACPAGRQAAGAAILRIVRHHRPPLPGDSPFSRDESPSTRVSCSRRQRPDPSGGRGSADVRFRGGSLPPFPAVLTRVSPSLPFAPPSPVLSPLIPPCLCRPLSTSRPGGAAFGRRGPGTLSGDAELWLSRSGSLLQALATASARAVG
jgi:hypothetical protein